MPTSTRENERYGLALSGGGFRATLFHLGVVACLRDNSVLSQINVVTSVSGGSILAAHMALRWLNYNGTQKQFEEAAKQIISFTGRNVRNRILRRWIVARLLVCGWFLPPWRLANLFTRELKRLYRETDYRKKTATTAHLAGSAAKPEFRLLGTSMTTGGLCSFTKDEFVYFDGAKENRLSAEFTLSDAVTASAAFPPLFAPFPVTRQITGKSVAQYPNEQFVTDGGIFDNTGAYALNQVAALYKIDELMISNAGGNFDWSTGESYRMPLGRNLRANDIVMDWSANRLLKELIGSRRNTVHIFIGRQLHPGSNAHAQCHDIQKPVREARTDLDRFTRDEVTAIIRHGYSCCAAELLDGTIRTVLAAPTWSRIVPGTRERALKVRTLGKRRALRLHDAMDIMTYILVAVVLAYACLIPHFRQLLFTSAHRSFDIVMGHVCAPSAHSTLHLCHVRTAYRW